MTTPPAASGDALSGMAGIVDTLGARMALDLWPPVDKRRAAAMAPRITPAATPTSTFTPYEPELKLELALLDEADVGLVVFVVDGPVMGWEVK